MSNVKLVSPKPTCTSSGVLSTYPWELMRDKMNSWKASTQSVGSSCSANGGRVAKTLSKMLSVRVHNKSKWTPGTARRASMRGKSERTPRRTTTGTSLGPLPALPAFGLLDVALACSACSFARALLMVRVFERCVQRDVIRGRERERERECDQRERENVIRERM
jgi:hypothetical protein